MIRDYLFEKNLLTLHTETLDNHNAGLYITVDDTGELTNVYVRCLLHGNYKRKIL